MEGFLKYHTILSSNNEEDTQIPPYDFSMIFHDKETYVQLLT